MAERQNPFSALAKRWGLIQESRKSSILQWGLTDTLSAMLSPAYPIVRRKSKTNEYAFAATFCDIARTHPRQP
jgi:hypothetical protein